MSTQETVGKRLKRLRLKAGLSQRDLSSPGVSYAYISRIEADARTPSVKALRKLAPKLGVTVEYLETGHESLVEIGLAECDLAVADLTDDEYTALMVRVNGATLLAAKEAGEQIVAAREATERAAEEARTAGLELVRGAAA